jgi:hypothetical protein
MAVFIRILAGLLLAAHGLVHLLYLVPEPDDPNYPFTLRSSWLIPEPGRRIVAVVLMTFTVAAFVALALAVWGVPGLSAAWPAIAVTAAGLSLALLIAFWDVRLSFGVVIDLGVIALAVLRPDWTTNVVG